MIYKLLNWIKYNHLLILKDFHKFLTTASMYSLVELFPPISLVLTVPSSKVLLMAFPI